MYMSRVANKLWFIGARDVVQICSETTRLSLLGTPVHYSTTNMYKPMTSARCGGASLVLQTCTNQGPQLDAAVKRSDVDEDGTGEGEGGARTTHVGEATRYWGPPPPSLTLTLAPRGTTHTPARQTHSPHQPSTISRCLAPVQLLLRVEVRPAGTAPTRGRG